MIKDKYFHFRIDEDRYKQIHLLIEEYCELAGITQYNHKSDVIAHSIIDGIKKLISSYVPCTKTNMQKCNSKQEKILIIQKITEDLIEEPREFESIFNQIFNNKIIFGLDVRTRLKWFYLLFEQPELRIIDLRDLDHTITDCIIINQNSMYFNQLYRYCNYFPIDTIKCKSIVTTKGARKLFYLIFREKFGNNKRPDKGENFMIKSLKFQMNYLGERPLLMDNITREIIDFRSKGMFKEAIELVIEEQKYKEAEKEKITIKQDKALNYLDELDHLGGRQ